MNTQQRIEWLKAFITLWDASDMMSNNGYCEHLSNALHLWCISEGLPQWSADDLLVALMRGDI